MSLLRLDFDLRNASLSGLSSEELSRLQQAYLESFPEDERRPWEQILSQLDERFRFAPLVLHGEIAGFVTLWLLPEAVYIEHLLTLEHMRGSGLGAAAVQQILDYSGHRPLVLEVEPEEASPMARRRLQFYQRLGLFVQPIEYIQPAYTTQGHPVPLHLMTSQETLPLSTLERIRTDLYTYVYKCVSQP